MKRNKFRYNRENITSRLFAQNRRNSRYDDDEEDEDEDHHGGGGMGAGMAMGLGAGALTLANQGLSAMGTIQGVRDQAGGIKGWWDRRQRRKADYKHYNGDEKAMERDRDKSYADSKNAKNSAEAAGHLHRESQLSDSLDYTRRKNAYKADMANQKSWVGKGTTWAKHNPWQAGAAVAGTAALAGGAYYMWKKRQEEKKRREKEKKERERQRGGVNTRHQSNITSRLFAMGRGVGYGSRGMTKNMFKTATKVKPGRSSSGMFGGSSSSSHGKSGIDRYQKSNPLPSHNSHTTSNPHTNHSSTLGGGSTGSATQAKQNLISDAKKGRVKTDAQQAEIQRRWNERKAQRRQAEIDTRREAKQNDPARREKTQERIRERKLGHQEKNIQELAKQTEELKTADSGVWSHNYQQKQKELRDARIEHHNTKFEGDKIGDLKERALGFKKFDKNGNLRWGKKRLAVGALGAYAAYNMMKDDDDDKK